MFVAAILPQLRGNAGTAVTVARVNVSGGAGGSIGITANGYVVARTRASVSSRVSGRLAVEEGSRVRRGEILAPLDNDDYTAAVAQAVAGSLRADAWLTEARAARGQATGRGCVTAGVMQETGFRERGAGGNSPALLFCGLSRTTGTAGA